MFRNDIIKNHLSETAVSLREVIHAFGYTDPAKQAALIKLAAYRGCFNGCYKDILISDDLAESLLLTSFDSLTIGINWWVDTLQKKMLRASFFKEGIGEAKDPIINVARWDF